MFEALGSGPRSVSDLAAALGVEFQLASKHVSELHRAGLVDRRQDGNFARYSLPDALTLKAVALICRSAMAQRQTLARIAEEVAEPEGMSRSGGMSSAG